MTTIVIHEGNEGDRVDVFLAKYLKRVSRSSITRFIKDGKVTINGDPVKASNRLKTGDVLEITDFHEEPFS